MNQLFVLYLGAGVVGFIGGILVKTICDQLKSEKMKQEQWSPTNRRIRGVR